MPRFKDHAIVIRETDWSETSQIVVLLTREHGKVRGLAKGAKRLSPSSIAKYSGGIELLTAGEVLAITRPTSDLATVTEWDLQRPHRHLRESLAAQNVAYYAADLCNAIILDHDPHPGAYAAMSDLLDELAGAARVPALGPAALLRFQWRLLSDCGYQPVLDRDAATGEAIASNTPIVFDARAGGVTRDTGVHGDEQTAGPWRVRAETIRTLRAVAESVANANGASGAAGTENAVGARSATSGVVATAALDAPSVARANRLLCVYARALLDRELPTMAGVIGET